MYLAVLEVSLIMVWSNKFGNFIFIVTKETRSKCGKFSSDSQRLSLSFYLCVWERERGCVSVQMCVVPQRPKEGTNSPVGGVIGSCELSKVDTGNPMWVLCKISKCLSCWDISAASIIWFSINHFVPSIFSYSIQLGKCGAGDIEFIVKKKKKKQPQQASWIQLLSWAQK